MESSAGEPNSTATQPTALGTPPIGHPTTPPRQRRRGFFWRLSRGRSTPPAVDLVSAAKARKPLYRHPLLWIGVIVGSGVAAGAWGLWTLEQDLPDAREVFTFVREGTLTIKADDGSVLQQLGPATRDNLAIAAIPPPLIQAFIASEDRRFYDHNGVDYLGIARAIAANIQAHELVEGGSTITQQLARIVFLNQERTAWRKVREALLAQKIEREIDKPKILEYYLNLVYLGSGAYGVADAAWVYFSKTVDQLTLPEAALIAGLAPAPSDYSPLVNPDLALRRRNVVLSRMQEAGFITPETAAIATASPLGLKPSLPRRLHTEAPYFTSYILKQLPKLVAPDVLELGGLTVETTLNPKWQRAAEQAVQQAITVDGPAEGFSQAALVAIDPRNGEIKAMVGGNDFGKSQFNRVTQAQRQPGSTFKTFVYTTAIAAGFSPYQTYLDAPYVIDGYEPQNYSRGYYGWLPLRDALAQSINIVAVKLLLDVGFDPVVKLTHAMGIQSKLNSTYSLALGASEVNLLELTSAYGTLAAQGRYSPAFGILRVRDRYGKILYTTNLQPKQVLDKDSAAIMTWMLQGVVDNGTGRAAQLGRAVAGKTGTSEEARDLWFVGYIPQLVAGVWLGNDNNQPTWGYSGTAAYTWHVFMNKLVQGMPVEPFPKLPQIEGRKGTIKVKPVQPSRIYNPYTAPDENRYYNQDYSGGAATPSTPAATGASESGSTSGSPPPG
ncbi:transglycosylase domain-containing protein [Neosynechococcus sphagnicola]|uniref:transglycosylase domain-containing protein n=1 Tax=Neosynechococcus sphagnicola TaxID=1501145 RepID=UPI00068CBE4A|nr:penicillin-binding protein 1A [Neosynechococcus sphagnicola]